MELAKEKWGGSNLSLLCPPVITNITGANDMPFSTKGNLKLPPGANVIKLLNPQGKNGTHIRASDSLFPKMPSPSDVNQGQIGNCYALASINAIVSKLSGPEIIMDNMIDNGTGNIIVRLFCKNEWRYYSVEKSVFRNVGLSKHSSGALWVVILEKAFRMLFSTGSYDDEKGSPESIIITALQGIDNQLSFSNAHADVQGMLNNLLIHFHNKTKMKPKQFDALKPSIINEILITEVNFNTFYAWNSEFRANKWLDKSPKQRTYTALKDNLDGLNLEVKQLILSFAMCMEAVEATLNSRYRIAERELYARIARAMATHTAVTAASNKQVSGNQSWVEKKFISGTAGEGRVAGIYTTHAYTVIGVQSAGHDYLGILLRNPHGKGGRKYRFDEKGILGEAVATKAAEFWVELGHFAADFNVTYGAPVVLPSRMALMVELKQKLASAG